ncbi:MAG TPA: helix-turn-helix domain-containing protein [Acidimicrobiia bacterium]|nr:helix-turn-helix domain-containing protein [Acidimicrobiia bacterium]
MTAAVEPARARRRMPAAERRQQLLAAARQAFADGEVGGTTIESIARVAGVTPAVIYQHFAGKEELYSAAIVEPLHDAVQTAVSRARALTEESLRSGDGHVSDIAEARRLTEQFYGSVLASLTEIVPLLGLVLFGEAGRAREFYQAAFVPAIGELESAMNDFADQRTDEPPFAPGVAARIVIGACLMFALEMRLNPAGVDFDEMVSQIATVMLDGMGSLLPDRPPPGARRAQAAV